MSLLRLFGDRVEVDSGSGKLVCRISGSLEASDWEKADLLIDNMMLGLSEIARLYPNQVMIYDVLDQK
jgi:uncharacterized protein YsxB (DUF464 family)